MCTTDFSVIWKTTLTELGKSPNCPHSQILPMTHWPSTHQHHPEMTLCSWHTDLRPINIILRWHCAAERTKTPNYCFMTSDQFTISLTQHKTLNCTSTAVYPFIISHFCRLPLFLLLSWSLRHGINSAQDLSAPSYPKDWTPSPPSLKEGRKGWGVFPPPTLLNLNRIPCPNPHQLYHESGVHHHIIIWIRNVQVLLSYSPIRIFKSYVCLWRFHWAGNETAKLAYFPKWEAE